ncbi:MAG TPA: hypothetical protein DD745_11480 [Bacteroidales bacterium]|nr:hypothetical protein [Bacteroidales bacterium]
MLVGRTYLTLINWPPFSYSYFLIRLTSVLDDTGVRRYDCAKDKRFDPLLSEPALIPQPADVGGLGLVIPGKSVLLNASI